jgi:prophage regulatory protein
MSDKRFLKLREVLSVTGLTRTSMYMLIKDGHFPAGINLIPGGRRVAWDSDEVQDWITGRIKAARRKA